MAEQRPFRFRLPWLSAASAPAPPPPPPPRPTVETQQPRPVAQTQPPAQPTTTTTPSQRPPFRPAGIAPPQPTPQATRTEPQPSQPSRAASEPRVASQPASPSRPTQTRAASVPPSASRGDTETRVIPQPASPPLATQTQPVSPTKLPTQAQPRAASVPPPPSRTATQGGPRTQSPSPFASRTTGQTSSKTSSPMRRATQVQPTARAVSQPPSPPKIKQPVIQETSRPPLDVIQPRSSIPREQELKPAATLQPSQEQPKTQIKSEIVSESQYQTAKETTSKTDRVAAQPTQASAFAPTSVAAPSEKRLMKTEDKKAVEEHVKEGKAQEQVKEEKSKGPVDEEQMWSAVSKLLTAASGAETQTREFVRATFQTEESRQAEQEISERKKPPISPKSDEKQIKTVSSTPLKDRERAPLQKEIRDDFLKFAHKLAIGHPKQPMDGKPVSIITVAGENRGASMHVGSESAKKDGSLPIHRGYKVNSSEIPETTTDDGEGSSKEKIPRDHKTKKDQATRTYINSNTQSINNSILLSSSVNERNPGVQLVVSHNPEELIKSAPQSESVETRRAQFSVTPAENLTYQPTIRRRCLRGLFMEPSDSDPDNPDKPRRHGCLYNCGEKSKDKEIGLL